MRTRILSWFEMAIGEFQSDDERLQRPIVFSRTRGSNETQMMKGVERGIVERFEARLRGELAKVREAEIQPADPLTSDKFMACVVSFTAILETICRQRLLVANKALEKTDSWIGALVFTHRWNSAALAEGSADVLYDDWHSTRLVKANAYSVAASEGKVAALNELADKIRKEAEDTKQRYSRKR